MSSYFAAGGSVQPKADRILVCGFGPFPGVPDNPTTALVRSLPWRLGGFNVHRWVLPVSWQQSGAWLRRRVQSVSPDLLLLTGVGSQAGTAQLETGATNRQDGRPDAFGDMLLPGPIDPRQKLGHRKNCPWPISDLVEGLQRRGHHVQASDDAGAYLCNHTLFHALDLPIPADSGFFQVRGGGYEGLADPRRLALMDLIRSLHLVLRLREAC